MKSTDIKNHKTSISQTHNLEVLGSSPSWSTLKISNLEEIRVADFSFCENNAKTIGLSSTPFSATFCNFLPFCFRKNFVNSRKQRSPSNRCRDLRRWYDLFRETTIPIWEDGFNHITGVPNIGAVIAICI